MSDTPPEPNSNSKSNLIEVQHVGVTAKLQSPLKSLLQTSSSSTETDHGQLLFHSNKNCHSKTSKYNKLSNGDSHVDTESTTDTSKVLYEMRTIRNEHGAASQQPTRKVTPSKIEFQLYHKPSRRLSTKRAHRPSAASRTSVKRKPSKRQLFDGESRTRCNETVTETSLFQRLRHSLDSMRAPKGASGEATGVNSRLFDDLPEPTTRPTTPRDTRIGIYPFEHGCAEYLRTTDCHPQILSVVLAERATQYATRFWAEFFGTLHIGVAFVVTFLLQTYRFLLYSVVNTLVVGFLHMTSDYLVKPLLTVAFNGFLQPPLILVFNVLTSVKDILEPVADTVNNFLKPVANVLRGVRLVQTTYNDRKTTKSV